MKNLNSVQPIVAKLEELFDVFNGRFFEGALQKPVITVSPDTSGAYGWVTTWKAWKLEGSEDEGFYEINVCAEHLSRPFKNVCATLLHEMTHLHNLQNGIKDTSRGNSYHNAKFKEEAEKRGLFIEKSEKYGWSITTLNEEGDEFVTSLNFDGFQLYRQKMTKVEKAKKKSSSRKYVCPYCDTIVRATKEVNITCTDCDVPFELEEGDEE